MPDIPYEELPEWMRLRVDPSAIPVDPSLADYTAYLESILQAIADNPWFSPVRESTEWLDSTRNLAAKWHLEPNFALFYNATEGIVNNWVAANVPEGID